MKTRLLSFLCAATVVAYLQRSALGVPSKQIEADLGLTAQDMGLVWLTWYAGYAAFQLPAGAIVQAVGSKPALVAFAVAWSVLTACTGAAGTFAGLCAWWGLMGVAQAGVFVCATKAVGATFPKTEQAFASGALACCMAGGAALSQYVTGRLLGPLTWHQILALYMVPGLVWALLFGCLVPSPEPPPVPEPNAGDSTAPPVRWSRLFTDRNMILLCVQQFMRAGATALFFTWFPRFLQETKGVTPAESGTLATWPLIAAVPAGLLGGFMSDRLLRATGRPRLSRQGLAGVCTALAAVLSLTAYQGGSTAGVVALVSAAGFFAYMSSPCAYATALAMGGTRVAPVFATMNMAGNVGAGLFPFAVGQLAGRTGNWNAAMLLFAGMFAASAACWAVLNPKGTLFEEAG